MDLASLVCFNFVDFVKITYENVALQHCEDAYDEERTAVSYAV
jgi:hypothetical protein